MPERSDDVFENKHLCNESENVSDITAITTTTYLLCIAVGLLSFFIMSGNLFLITSIVYFKQLHTPTNFLILSLAVADLLVGVLVLPFSLTLAIGSCWYLEHLQGICKVRESLDIFFCLCSILNLFFISVDRYYAVCQPLRYRAKINVHVIVVMILGSWTVSALFGINVTIRGLNQRKDNKRCVLFQSTSSAIVGTVLAFYPPAITMFTIYLKILMVAQRQARRIQSTTCQSTKSEAAVSKVERKATKTLAIVMGIFLMCWTPFSLCITFNPLSSYTMPVPMIETFKWLAWSNSMLNPLIYAFFYSWFRSAFRMIISGKIFQGDFTLYKLF